VAAARRWIEPLTGDYVVERGGPRSDSTRASQVLLRLRMKRGTCAVRPQLGSRLHTIRKATAGAARLADGYALESLDDLIRSEAIRNVRVTSTVYVQPAAIGIEVAFEDSSSETRTVTYTSQIGGA